MSLQHFPSCPLRFVPSPCFSLTEIHPCFSATSTNCVAAFIILAAHSATTSATRGHSTHMSFSASVAETLRPDGFSSSSPLFFPRSSTSSVCFSQLRRHGCLSSRRTGSLARALPGDTAPLPSALFGSATPSDDSGSTHSIQFDRMPNQTCSEHASASRPRWRRGGAEQTRRQSLSWRSSGLLFT